MNPIINFITEWQRKTTDFMNDWWWAIIIGVGLIVLLIGFRIFIQGAGLK